MSRDNNIKGSFKIKNLNEKSEDEILRAKTMYDFLCHFITFDNHDQPFTCLIIEWKSLIANRGPNESMPSFKPITTYNSFDNYMTR